MLLLLLLLLLHDIIVIDFKRSPHLLLLILLLHTFLLLFTLELRGTTLVLTVPAHLVLVSCLLKDAEAIQVFDSNERLLKVVRLELVEIAKTENLFLLELSHQNFFHLLVRKFTIIVKSHRMNVTLPVFFKLHFMFNDLDASFEDAFILDSLANPNFTSSCS